MPAFLILHLSSDYSWEASRPPETSLKKLVTGQGGGFPLSSTSIAAPLSSCWGPAVLLPGLLEVHDRGLLRASTSPTWPSAQLCSAAIEHQSNALSAATGQQQERASKHLDSLHGRGPSRECQTGHLQGFRVCCLSSPNIPGRLNVLADKLLRRNQIIGTEWSLHAPRHNTPHVLHLVHSGIGSICNSSQSQAARVCVSSSRSQSSRGGYSVHSVGQAKQELNRLYTLAKSNKNEIIKYTQSFHTIFA